MPWIRFTADFDWRPKHGVTIAYKAGMVKLVTTPCAVAAIAAGKAERTVKPKSSNDEVDDGTPT